jgi:sugar phosphate isomerase/epimerase
VPELKIGIQLASLRQPLRQALHTAARLGAAGVEVDARGELRPGELGQTGLRHIRKLLEELNLRVCAVRFRTRRGYDVSEDLERRVAATKEALRLAAELRAPFVVNAVGYAGAGPESPGWQGMVEALTDIGRAGQRLGALFLAETGSEPGPDLARLVAALPEGSLGVDLNPGNLIVNGHSPRETVAALGPQILHVHAHDAVRDTARGRGLEVQLGRGSADFPELLGALEEWGYRGYFTIERTGAEDPVAEVEQAVSYLRRL